jgi:hypothetical protein
MITRWAGSNQVAPDMLTTLTAWYYMVDGEMRTSLSTVLASVIITPQDFTFA